MKAKDSETAKSLKKKKASKQKLRRHGGNEEGQVLVKGEVSTEGVVDEVWNGLWRKERPRSHPHRPEGDKEA